MTTTLHLIYFSPTTTTRKIVERIAAGLKGYDIEHHDLTRSEGLELHLADGLAIIGIPVYAGRVPEVFLKRIEKLSASGVPAVLVGLYGNREFEDALVELRDVAQVKGFTVIAAGAFIGEHSYSTSDRPIAANRPDAADLRQAEEFGARIARKLHDNTDWATPEIPGNTPYRDRPPLGGIAPETDPARCTLCGTCATVCPTFVITVGTDVVTDAANCIMCCACVRSCPANARDLQHPLVNSRREMLLTNYSARKEPVCFL